MSQSRVLLTALKPRAGKGPLSDITVAVKDLLVMDNGVPTTAASNILRTFVSPYNATVIERLEKAGAQIIGKTNLDEFAMGSSNETSAFGVVCNPWDETRVPGGSSGGSAAAVASGIARTAIGTDTGGSIRQPAAFTGVLGLKPTYGRVSRFGVTAMASSLDQVGVFARTVEDVASVLEVVAGTDPHDATTVDRPVPPYAANLSDSVAGKTIGLPKEYFIDGLQPEIAAAVEAAASDYERAGAKVVEVSLPHTKYAVAVYYIVMAAEASSNLSRYDGIRYHYSVEDEPDATIDSLEDVYLQTRSRGFGEEVKRRIMLGTYVLSAGYYDAYYKKAMQVRTLIKQDFDQAFAEVDAILAPVTPTTAFKIGEKIDDPLQMYLNDILTIPVNLAGLPAISVPAGFDAQRLPIGLQLIGPQFGEEVILSLANTYQQIHDWHLQEPPKGDNNG
jgi:aspartyl-tRNA(Asn)/glutamyl-tRNA(Gln) amidotransferase subunit A